MKRCQAGRARRACAPWADQPCALWRRPCDSKTLHHPAPTQPHPPTHLDAQLGQREPAQRGGAPARQRRREEGLERQHHCGVHHAMPRDLATGRQQVGAEAQGALAGWCKGDGGAPGAGRSGAGMAHSTTPLLALDHPRPRHANTRTTRSLQPLPRLALNPMRMNSAQPGGGAGAGRWYGQGGSAAHRPRPASGRPAERALCMGTHCRALWGSCGRSSGAWGWAGWWSGRQPCCSSSGSEGRGGSGEGTLLEARARAALAGASSRPSRLSGAATALHTAGRAAGWRLLHCVAYRMWLREPSEAPLPPRTG